MCIDFWIWYYINTKVSIFAILLRLFDLCLKLSCFVSSTAVVPSIWYPVTGVAFLLALDFLSSRFAMMLCDGISFVHFSKIRLKRTWQTLYVESKPLLIRFGRKRQRKKKKENVKIKTRNRPVYGIISFTYFIISEQHVQTIYWSHCCVSSIVRRRTNETVSNGAYHRRRIINMERPKTY